MHQINWSMPTNASPRCLSRGPKILHAPRDLLISTGFSRCIFCEKAQTSLRNITVKFCKHSSIRAPCHKSQTRFSSPAVVPSLLLPTRITRVGSELEMHRILKSAPTSVNCCAGSQNNIIYISRVGSHKTSGLGSGFGWAISTCRLDCICTYACYSPGFCNCGLGKARILFRAYLEDLIPYSCRSTCSCVRKNGYARG